MRLLAAAFFLCALAQGQTAKPEHTGEIRLRVNDASGAAMQATVKLQDRTFATDAQGAYTLRDLPFGHYQLEVARAGFTTQSLTIDVESSAPVSRVVRLETAAERFKMDVVASTPLPGIETPLDEIPAPVQTATQADVANSGALDLPDLMNRRLNGVHLNEVQGNPFQADLNFRGYTASPLLGTPQGISIYLDGVRQNQPFGDVVSWDLIENNAISSMTLMPGSDPLFGLNTLGGAVSVQTKDGVSNPGLQGSLTYGSSGRKALQASIGGGNPTGFNWFLAANAFHESGWRFDSPSDIRQGFARLGWRAEKTDIALTTSYAYNTLTGNGVQDYRLFARDYSGVYTVPDTIGNRAPSITLNIRRTASAALTFAGNVYFRNIRTETINGNLNPNSLDEAVYQPTAADQAALTAAGYTGFPTSGASAANTPFPFWRCIAQGLQHAEAIEKCNAVYVYTRTAQNNYGFSAQLTRVSNPHGINNQFTAGAAFDRSIVDFTENTQFGYLNPNGSITGINAWEDGSTNSNGDPVDTRVDLHGLNHTWSLYGIDRISFGRAWHLSLAGRYNRDSVSNADRISPGGGAGSLDGQYTFSRFNPSVGLTYGALQKINVYGSYTQGSRAPSSIELGCADALNPCSLPNALASDPPLNQVVTGTWEAGLRGRAEGFSISNIAWSAGAFRADNRDDILFVSAPQTGAGYFKSFGKTRREGVQADLSGRVRRVTAGLDYTFLAATYQSVEIVDGSANNTSDTALAGLPGLDGTITVHPGNRIPLVPKQTGKAYADIQATSKLLIDLGMVAVSSSYARGNENNAYEPDGKYYLGPGVAPGYVVFNLAAHYNLMRRLQLGVRVDNVLDRHFYTAAQLVSTGFTPQYTYLARPFPAYSNGDYALRHALFLSPGAPRRFWIEAAIRF